MERESLLKPFYANIYNLFDGREDLISVTVSYVLMVGVFWAVGGFLLIADLTDKPKWIRKYKVQKDANFPIDRSKLRKVLKTVLFNNIVLNAIFAYPIYLQQVRAGCSLAVNDTPTWNVILRDLIICTIVQEIIFYYSHRLFHHPLIYKTVHSKHHQWSAPIGIVAIYTTPIEYLTGNGLSVFLGPLLCRSHIVFWWIWYSLASAVTVIHHSGYHLPLFPSPQFHDYHHLTFNWNFGTLGILDWLHGTDKGFRKTVQRKRHRMLWSPTPMDVLFPVKKESVDEKNQKEECKKNGLNAENEGDAD